MLFPDKGLRNFDWSIFPPPTMSEKILLTARHGSSDMALQLAASFNGAKGFPDMATAFDSAILGGLQHAGMLVSRVQPPK